MKTFIVLVLISSNAYCQDLKTLDLKYIEVVALMKKQNEIYLTVDDGAGINYKNGKLLKDESGQDKVFTGTTQILNYLDEEGWEYVDSYNENSSGFNITKYIFRKKEG